MKNEVNIIYRPCVFCADTKEIADNRSYKAILSLPPISNKEKAQELLFQLIPESLEKVQQIYPDSELESVKVGNCFYIKEKDSIIGFIGYGCVNILYHTEESGKWIYGNFSIYEYKYNLSIKNYKNELIDNIPIVNDNKDEAFNKALDIIDNLYHNQNYDS